MKNSNLLVIQMANMALNAVCSAASGVAMVTKANFSDRGVNYRKFRYFITKPVYIWAEIDM